MTASPARDPQRRGPAQPVAPAARAAVLFTALLVLALAITTAGGRALAADPPAGLGGFDAGYLISDAEMFAGTRLDAAAIDARLATLGASCVSGRSEAPCLKDLRVTTPQRAATRYCAAVPARQDVSVGRMIADVSVACSVNPQVVIVMLQKEQGLVTSTAPTWRMVNQALGFRCPDFRTCDPAYAGIANQIYHASSRLQEYGDPARGYTYGIGSQLVAYSPYPFCGSARVQIRNRATAALYNYTPYTPTQRSLDAGAGVVPDDVCATYGNRNFFRIYQQWFGSPTGADPRSPARAAPLGAAPTAPFTDVPFGPSMFFTEIAWMKHTGLSTGYPDGSYRPTASISREAMAAFLYRAAGSPAFTPPAVPSFPDVRPSTSIFFTEVEWAKARGITTGYPDGTFRPLDPVNRDAMAAFLYRAAGSPAFTPPAGSAFRDVPGPSAMFFREISWARSSGITTGYPDGSYRPTEPISREAMAAFVYRWRV